MNEEKRPADIVSVKMTQYILEDACDEISKLSPEEINQFLEQIENKNFRNYLQKEIFDRLGKIKKK